MHKKTYDKKYLSILQGFFNEIKMRGVHLLNIRNGDLIIDVGCGVGYDAELIAKEGVMFIGIDHDIEFIKAAQDNVKSPNVRFIWSDAENINLCNKVADIIRIDRVLQHNNDIRKIIRECKRILKHAGRFQIIDTDYSQLTLKNVDTQFQLTLIEALYKRFRGAENIKLLPFILKSEGFDICEIENFKYEISDFSFANYIIRFDKIINDEYNQGYLQHREYEYWLHYRESLEFSLSLTLTIYNSRLV